MPKTFNLENDVGIEVKYTILGVTKNEGTKYVVYTNYLPSDNEFGIRLFASELINENPFEVNRITKIKEKEIIEEFKIELIHLLNKSGK